MIERYDGTKWGKEKGTGAGLLLDAAVGSTYTVATSILPILVSKDEGKKYTTVEDLGGASQSAHVIDDVISLVGSFVIPAADSKPQTAYGVARSADGGDHWSVSKVADGYCRYGAFPSENVWYVANGIWGNDPAAGEKFTRESMSVSNHMKAAMDSFQPYDFSARAKIGGVHIGGVTFHDRPAVLTRGMNATETGWFGSISKTVDGGKTFSTVFQSDLTSDYYYFNSISCSSDSHCVAVAEGDDAVNGGYLVRAYVTFDGGVTWTNSLTKDVVPSNVVSIMGSAWIDDNEGWLGATAKDRSVLSGVFFHTTDGGKTYSVEQTLDNCFLMDMSFANGVGYASCSSSSGASASVAMYV
jgi:hypothetical protein